MDARCLVANLTPAANIPEMAELILLAQASRASALELAASTDRELAQPSTP